ncbi:MAG TPA: 3-deoxy-manno-octulosonate cytidylyltransferase, partial [Leptospiraceae bacterium]|nr:3-deoxy-manno-octulosonate cytidylyltransferase [Leptospiraceae bacterium]
DDERIAEAVRSFKGNVVMTSNSHPTGTDRILEVISKTEYKDYDIIVNIQGDEPGIDVGLIDGVTELKLRHRDWEMSTACCRIWDKNELSDPNRVKVAFTKQGKALYFSRSLIPSNFKEEVPVYRHLGIYCYEKEFLLNYSSLPESSLEKSESLEQLRALENGSSIGVFITDHAGLSVDSPADLEAVAADFRKRGLIA